MTEQGRTGLSRRAINAKIKMPATPYFANTLSFTAKHHNENHIHPQAPVCFVHDFNPAGAVADGDMGRELQP